MSQQSVVVAWTDKVHAFPVTPEDAFRIVDGERVEVSTTAGWIHVSTLDPPVPSSVDVRCVAIDPNRVKLRIACSFDE